MASFIDFLFCFELFLIDLKKRVRSGLEVRSKRGRERQGGKDLKQTPCLVQSQGRTGSHVLEIMT